MRKTVLSVMAFTLLTVQTLHSQEEMENPLKKGVKFSLSEDGKYSMSIGFSTQLWARYTQLNPNTLDLTGEEINGNFDFLIRRSTVKIQASMDRFYFFSLFGLRSQTQMASYAPFSESTPQFLFYDLYSSYSLFKRHLYIGYGLHLYHGLSRYSSATAISTLGADIPMLGAPNLFTSEQIARNLGLFVDGLAGSLHYRLVLASPFTVTSVNRPSIGVDVAFDIPNTSLKTEGYFAWQFWDKQLIPVPFTTATYLGKKKMLNLGVGFKYQPNSTASLTATGDTLFHDQLHFAADLFMDLPLGNGSALTFYGAYFLFDFGPNYLLSGGFGNTFQSSSPRGAGNAEPLSGTGSGITTQLGYLLPNKIGKTGRLQPYYEGEYRFYDALDDNAFHHNIGINYYILDHNLKTSLQHDLRPYFDGAKQDSYKSQIVLKLQVFI